MATIKSPQSCEGYHEKIQIVKTVGFWEQLWRDITRPIRHWLRNHH